MSSNGAHVCHTQNTTSSLYQTLDELDFERGIWCASQCGDLEKVKKLLDKGVNVDQRDSAGYTALHYAARNGHLNVCKFLLENKAAIDSQTKGGQATALHRASSSGKTDVVKYLLENGADVNLKDADGKTSLHRAAENQNEEICRVILAIRPDLKYETDCKGNKAIDYAENKEMFGFHN